MTTKTTFTLLLLTLALSLSSAYAHAQEVLQSPDTPVQNAPADPKSNTAKDTPEYAMQKFMLAMISSDLKMLKKFSHPHDDIELLLPEQKIPEAAFKQIKAAFAAMPITRLKVGDSATLPGGQSVTFDETSINEKKALLTSPGNPFPFPVARIDGQWKVNPTKIIAVRKASKRLRQKNKNAIQPAPRRLEQGSGAKQQQPK